MINITTPLIYSYLDISTGLAIYENGNIISDLCCKSVSKDKKVNLSGIANVFNRSKEADLDLLKILAPGSIGQFRGELRSQDIFPWTSTLT